MKIALAPIRLSDGDNQANLRGMAQVVNDLQQQAALIVFPQVPLGPNTPASPDDPNADFLTTTDRQIDIVAAMATKRRVAITVCFIESAGAAPCGVLILASASGQICTRKFALPASETIEEPVLLGARVLGVPIVLGVGDIMEAREDLESLVRDSGAAIICIPLCFAGGDEELGRIAAHNPPAALAALKDELARIARETRTNVLAVNSIGADSETHCGNCGGVFHFDPRGRLVEEKHLFYEGVLFFDAPEPSEG